MRYLKKSQRGDTLIEVLLAVAVLSSIIGIAYSTTSRAQRTSQLVQERAEATQDASTQLERLRKIRDDPQIDSTKFFALITPARAAGFCLPNSPTPTPIATPYNDNFVLASDVACLSGPGSRYRRTVTYNGASKLFTATVQWQSAASANQQNVTVSLRIW